MFAAAIGIAVVLASAASAAAQAADATLSGIVADQSGAAVAGVELTLADAARGVQRTTTSNAAGEYLFAGVPAGTYVLTAGSGAFAPVRINGIVLAAGASRSLPIALKIATLSESVSVTADAGNPSNAATIGKTARTLREIPQSVSVITRERLDAQNVVTLEDAMSLATGVGSYGNASGAATFYARGYPLEAQYDGVPGTSSLNQSQFDTALYERVEVLRGPAGLLQGSGNPSGTVNLVRKRPQREYATRVSLTAGSWNNYHGDIDVTGALNRTGTLRGRAVVAGQDREFYYDVADQQGWTGYGVLEFDATPSTTIGGSYGVQHSDVMPFSGLPAYATGEILPVPRSTFLDPEWSHFRRDIKEGVVDVSQRIGRAWVAKLAVRRRDMDTAQRNSIPRAPLVPGVNRTNFQLTNGNFDYAGTGADANLSGAVTLFGRRQELLVGYNVDIFGSESASANATLSNRDVFAPALDVSLLPAITSKTANRIRQSGLYGMARLKLLEPLTVIVGARASNYSSRSRTLAPATTPWAESAAKAENEITPYAGVIVDVVRRTSWYASYADTFVPQSQLDYLGNVIGPRIGWQVETGIKSELVDGRVTASLSVFRIRDSNRAMVDPDHVGCGNSATSTCYMAAGLVQSQGWEAEIVGRPASGWELTVGYTDNDNKYVRDTNALYTGHQFWTYSPARVLKLWSNYRFDRVFAGSPLSRVNVGVAVRAQSRIYTNITYTVSGNVGLEQGAYAIADLQAGYRLSDRAQATLTVNNVTDRVYYRQINDGRGFNYYGEPRNAMLALRVRF